MDERIGGRAPVPDRIPSEEGDDVTSCSPRIGRPDALPEKKKVASSNPSSLESLGDP